VRRAPTPPSPATRPMRSSSDTSIGVIEKVMTSPFHR
jgi:hypothetical protein